MPNNKLVKSRSIEEIRKSLSESSTGFDAGYVLKEADTEMNGFKGPKEITSNSQYYKAMTLFEFDKGVLLLNSLPELHRVFALDFNKQLQAEYNCQTPSEKALAETVTLNFVRILETQRKIKDKEESMETRYDIQYLDVLSKELDRAQRHYLTSLETLRMIHNPTFNMNIKTQTAVIGQNQAFRVDNP